MMLAKRQNRENPMKIEQKNVQGPGVRTSGETNIPPG